MALLSYLNIHTDSQNRRVQNNTNSGKKGNLPRHGQGGNRLNNFRRAAAREEQQIHLLPYWYSIFSIITNIIIAGVVVLTTISYSVCGSTFPGILTQVQVFFLAL